MQPPSIRDLPQDLGTAVDRIARALADRQVRCWLVGGAVRDLALGRAPKDADLASAATPEQVANWFPDAIGVGAAFGTMVLPPKVTGGATIELTTFRSEREHSDGRRPDLVTYSETPEVDARRRDFTCNALYLDPLRDELLDPTGGLADLSQGLLRAIGEPAERFREDALRILRLARFAARFDLRIEPRTERAARAEVRGLELISAERTAQELEGMFRGPDPGAALRVLEELGALPRAWPALGGAPEPAHSALLGALPKPTGATLGFAAVLFGARRGGVDPSGALEALKPSRERTKAVLDLLRARDAVAEGAERAPLLRALRASEDALVFALARGTAACGLGPDEARLARAESIAAEVPPEARRPALLLDAAALMAAGVERGPRLGELLAELEDAQLDGDVRDADQARAWLEQQL